MAGPDYPGLDTLALHAGAQPDPATGARATPIYQSASFCFPDSDYAASLFNIERAGHVYSRLSNPTNAVLEERIAALEGGVGAIATASGQAALHLAIITLMGAGSHIVASAALSMAAATICWPTPCRVLASKRPSWTPAIRRRLPTRFRTTPGWYSARRWVTPASTC